jgi:hypothetical protein
VDFDSELDEGRSAQIGQKEERQIRIWKYWRKMKLQEIKDAVDAGKVVYWKSGAYQVVRSGSGYYISTKGQSPHMIGLTWTDGKTLNGKEEDFFIYESPKMKRGGRVAKKRTAKKK